MEEDITSWPALRCIGLSTRSYQVITTSWSGRRELDVHERPRATRRPIEDERDPEWQLVLTFVERRVDNDQRGAAARRHSRDAATERDVLGPRRRPRRRELAASNRLLAGAAADREQILAGGCCLVDRTRGER